MALTWGRVLAQKPHCRSVELTATGSIVVDGVATDRPVSMALAAAATQVAQM